MSNRTYTARLTHSELSTLRLALSTLREYADQRVDPVQRNQVHDWARELEDAVRPTLHRADADQYREFGAWAGARGGSRYEAPFTEDSTDHLKHLRRAWLAGWRKGRKACPQEE
jgi:ribosome modulation factor